MASKTELFESMFESSIQPIIVIDRLGRVQHYNPASEKLFQYTAEEMIGKNIKNSPYAPALAS
jgi:PAS domain S-box-containing protein